MSYLLPLKHLSLKTLTLTSIHLSTSFAEYTDFWAKGFCLVLFLNFRVSLSHFLLFHGEINFRKELFSKSLYHKEQLRRKSLSVGQDVITNALGVCEHWTPACQHAHYSRYMMVSDQV